ncbi:MAG: hypothetical protein WAQ98_14300 [Blastocatellia bacterium]
MKRLLLLITAIILLTFSTIIGLSNANAFSPQLNRDRFSINLVEPDGFLGLRLGGSFRYAEDLFCEPSVVRNGSIEWRFTSAEYDPYEGLTVLGTKKSIDGFVAYLRPGRIQFKEMDLYPKQNKLGAFSASRQYVVGSYKVRLIVEGLDSNYVRRIIMQAEKQ